MSRPAVTFGEAFRFWLKLGFISFGGPAGQIAVMHRELVERRRWISERRFLHALNYCMLLPGPEAQQLATYVGWLLHRTWGGLVAGGLFVLPSVFILLGLSYLYAAHGETPAVAGVLYGVRPVVVAIVLEAVLRIGRRAIRQRGQALIAGAAFVALFALDAPFPLVVLGAGLAGWLGSRGEKEQEEELGRAGKDPEETATALDDELPAAPHTRPSRRRLAVTVAGGAGLWLLGLAVLALWRGPESLHVRQYTYFTQAAWVTFGGAYAVLVYVAQSAVDTFGWLSPTQMTDGLALAETTPGPLIMVLQFVGFMAGWNHPEGMTPLASAVAGALVTTYATFLPSFLFIFAGAPYIEGLRAHRGLAAALRGVTAAVVGVVLHLGVVLGGGVLLPAGRPGGVDWVAAALVGVSFVAAWRLRVGVVWLVLAGGALGLLLRLAVG